MDGMDSLLNGERRWIVTDVVENIDLAPKHPDHFRLTLSSDWLASEAQPGQFIHILPPTDDEILRRPFSILSVDTEKSLVTFLFRVIGGGTRLLSTVKTGDKLDLIGPLGHGFPIDLKSPAILVGGGVGIPPLVFLAEKLKVINPSVILGARDSETLVCVDEFKKLGIEPVTATEDGSDGIKGLATDAMNQLDAIDTRSVVYSCGPIPMLEAVANWCKEKGIFCVVSMESKLGCGVGACLGCGIPIREPDGSVHYERVCHNGPAFDAARVAFDLMH